MVEMAVVLVVFLMMFMGILEYGRYYYLVQVSNNAVREAAKNGTNLMFPIIEAVKEYATIGEISNVMREVFGEYKERIVI